jgi:hypothetical protein
MDELEKIKIFFQYKARLQDLKIQRLKLNINLTKIDEEEAKIQKHLANMPDPGEV